MLGRTLSHYKIERKLASGGMGDVYVAEDTKLGRKVAVKILPPEMAHSAERRKRFEQEARSVAALSHRNVLAIHDFGDDQGVFFAVMELLDGMTLREALSEGPLPVAAAVEHAQQIIEGLAAAHEQGIVHRDLKPENLFITKEGVVKILDFGLAKQSPLEDAADDASPTRTRHTEPGVILGTIGYMSPEQVSAKSVDARSDIFSFGTVLYEMLTGRRAFDRDSAAETMSAILNEEPPPISETSSDLESIARRCLAKNPDERFRTSRDLLVALRTASATPRGSGTRKTLLPAFVAVVLLASSLAWVLHRQSKVRWAREEALPEIARMVDDLEEWRAFQLGREVEQYLGDDPALTELWDNMNARPMPLRSDPPGASVYLKEYGSSGDWLFFGETPIEDFRFPWASQLQLRKEGFVTVDDPRSERARARAQRYVLDREGSIPPGMVRVTGGDQELNIPSLEHLATVYLGDFFIDRYEVTNRQYREFVEDGGYQNRKYWRHELVKEGRTLSWDEASQEFPDATGRPGPATWELGDYPEGQDEFPVTGISWYEATAYAEYAGKSLPTMYHWNRAAGGGSFAEYIVRRSNFAGQGLSQVGTYRGMGRHGTYDLAGNAREWSSNETTLREKFILGGSWDDPEYMFFDPNKVDPWDRSPANGFRCIQYVEPAENLAELREPIELPQRDVRAADPVSDDVFDIYKSLYAYDKTDLNATIESVTQVAGWRNEKVRFDAAYGNDRVVAHLLLPKSGSPPFQTIVFFPGREVIDIRSSSPLPPGQIRLVDFFLKSGRAVLYPIYKGTFERQDGLETDIPNGSHAYREYVLQWAKDLSRAIDYLETRSDIDTRKLAYYGLSWGGQLGNILPAVEERFAAAILQTAGLGPWRALPEVDTLTFVSRVTVPVLLLNGRYDPWYPVETDQNVMFQRLGTPPEDKRHVVFETGHFLPRSRTIKESLDWLDRYLGPVE